VGLAALPDDVTAAYVTTCDVPLLKPDFVRRIVELHEAGRQQGYKIAVPYCGGYHQPLAAVYSKSILPHVERLLAEGRLGPVHLADPADYQAALAEAGFELDASVARRLDLPATP
jgi:molybdopterin-guanine dinucleotide biosynthesis protein A